MNILHINKFHYLRGGSEVAYFMTARLLEDHGHRSVFFSMHHPDNLPCETAECFMSYVDLNSSNGFVSELKMAGRILYSLEARKRLSKLLDKYPVDIAHLHNIYHYISPSILHELKKRRIPIVMTLHDYKLVCASYRLLANGEPCEACHGGKYFKAIKKGCVENSLAKSILAALEMYLHHKFLEIFKNVDIFISPSLFLKNKLGEMGFNKEIIYLPNFVDIKRYEEFDTKRTYEKVEEPNSVVYFGRLSREKGLRILIEAAELLLRKNRRIEIKIIGIGPLKDELEKKAESEVIKNVSFLGFKRGEDLFQEVMKSMAVVLPSEWYENNPLSILEAFSMGIPVIGAKIGGIPELVKDNETGLTFEPGNSKDLASKIEYMVNNPDKVAEMGGKVRVYVEQELDAEKHYERLMEIYNQLTAHGS